MKMAHKYKYCVMFAYLCTSVNEVKFEYVENIACNKAEAISSAKSYLSQFGDVQGLTVIEVTREYEVRE
jgi:hypothetical protein|nr:MAG TPA: hypothetical protein [Caudoviricetes sp.]